MIRIRIRVRVTIPLTYKFRVYSCFSRMGTFEPLQNMPGHNRPKSYTFSIVYNRVDFNTTNHVL